MSTIEAEVTCTAPVNIAVIKYWGKRDVPLNLPCNSSLSVTLDQQHLQSKTSIQASKSFEKDRIWLNGVEEDINNKRLQTCLREIRKIAKEEGDVKGISDMKVHICSYNNFPTAAGLASSASGYACLVYTLAQLHGLKMPLENLSTIARQGSGSACRSLFGGFVKWEMGEKLDGSDSRAVQVAPKMHWPEMEILILVVSDHKKSTSSTDGMQLTMATSPLIVYRAEKVVPERMKQIEEAIQKKDFETFGKITIQDSNQFHAVCLDTYPPISYLNDTSRDIIRMLTKYNEHCGKIKAAYTFDAGPNAVIYALKEDIKEIAELALHFFPKASNQTDKEYFADPFNIKPSSNKKDWYDQLKIQKQEEGSSLRYIIHTAIGDGPQTINDSLLDSSGQPKKYKRLKKEI